VNRAKLRQALTLTLLVFTSFSFLHAGALRPGYVYDYAYILTEAEAQAIAGVCRTADNVTGAEIVVVTVENLDEWGGDIDLARFRVFNEYSLDGVVGIGKEGEDNGVLILLGYEERAWGIEVGLGLEGELTDSKIGRIGRDYLEPYLRDGDYYTGLFVTVAQIAEEVGYDVESFEPLDEGPSIVDVFLSDPLSILIWFFVNGGSGAFVAILVLVAILLVFRARFSGGGGRSRGGGASGRW